MTTTDSVTDWIIQLRDGHSDAATHLWQRYFQQMVVQARNRLHGARRAATDEEDVALSAFMSFCTAAQAGRFPNLSDRQGLWPLLLSITAHKAVDSIRYQNRKRRGGTGTEASPDGQPQPAAKSPSVLSPDELVGREPSPEFTATLTDELDALLGRLDQTGDADLKEIVLLKLEGLENQAIANQCGCAKRTIERKLHLIRRLMMEGVGDE